MVPALICGGEGLLLSFPQQNSANKKHIQWIFVFFEFFFPHWIHIGKILSVCFWMFLWNHIWNMKHPARKTSFSPWSGIIPKEAGSTVGAVDPTVVLVRGIRMRQMSRERTKQVDSPGEHPKWDTKRRWGGIQWDTWYITRWLHRNEHLVGNKLASLVSLGFFPTFSDSFCVPFWARFTTVSQLFHPNIKLSASADATSFPLGEERVGCPGGGKPQVTHWGQLPRKCSSRIIRRHALFHLWPMIFADVASHENLLAASNEGKGPHGFTQGITQSRWFAHFDDFPWPTFYWKTFSHIAWFHASWMLHVSNA